MNKRPNPCFQAFIPTCQGPFAAAYSTAGLCKLSFPSRTKICSPQVQREPPLEARRWHALTAAAVQNILAGRPAGKLPPLDLAAGTEFQKLVWGALSRIGRGETRSYAEVAQAIGRPKATRAVGAACGANPIPLLIPCHRVLAANHKLGGFSGGLHWKRMLLAAEQGNLLDGPAAHAFSQD